jgi:hypothetical protein
LIDNLWANTVEYNLLRKVGEPSLKKSIK